MGFGWYFLAVLALLVALLCCGLGIGRRRGRVRGRTRLPKDNPGVKGNARGL